MSNVRRPRKGSLQFWPRKRARRIYPRIRSWVISNEARLQGFAGYKVGMTHVQAIDNSGSITKGMIINIPVTIIECPPILVFALRFYNNTNQGLKLVGDIYNEKLDKNLSRKINLPKIKKAIPPGYNEIRALIYTQPHLTRIGKKKSEIFEIKLGNPDLEYAKSLFNKHINIQDVFKEGQLVDIHAVTKGKGFQGQIKRFGLKLKQHKSEKKKRSAGNLGPWTPSKVKFTVPQPGQMGYHTRTEYNKQIIKIGIKEDWKDHKSGFNNYGIIQNDYILIKGSITGSKKRLIQIIDPLRKKNIAKPTIQYIHQK